MRTFGLASLRLARNKREGVTFHLTLAVEGTSRRAVDKSSPGQSRLDRAIAEQRRHQAERAKTYREQALKLLPWTCGRCGREFSDTRVRELTVHHKDGNHDNNPPDGSNWELLCIYCHENEHSRFLEADANPGAIAQRESAPATHQPFAGLKGLLKRR